MTFKQGDLIMKNVDIIKVNDDIYNYILATESDDSLDNHFKNGGKFETHIFSKLTEMEYALCGKALCTFLQSLKPIPGTYKHIKQCVEIQYSESLDIQVGQIQYFATFEMFHVMPEEQEMVVKVQVLDANDESHLVPLHCVTVSI